jgi:gliding motility-associated-like protein
MPNKGQWRGDYTYRAGLRGGSFFARTDGWTISLLNHEDHHAAWSHFHRLKRFDTTFHVRRHALRITLKGCMPVSPVSLEEGEARYHYFLGSDSTHWKTDLRAAQRLRWKHVYPGIDLEYDALSGFPRSTWLLEPGADPGRIQMLYEGQEGIWLDEQGSLRIRSSLGDWIETAPLAWQIRQGDTIPVPARFITNGQTVSFSLTNYDRSLPLVIDPTLVFSTYSGSEGDNFGFTATYDEDGNLYAGGIVDNSEGEYPVTPGAYQTIYGGGVGVTPANLPADISISKYSSDGKQLLYATYIGGWNDEYPHSLVVDKSNNLWILGTTASNNFPGKRGYDTSFNGAFDIFVMRLNAAGNALLAGTFMGGSNRDGLVTGTLRHNYADDFRGDIITDDSNHVFVATCTQSSNARTSAGAFQKAHAGGLDAYIFSFDSTLNTLRWSTFYGTSGSEAAYSVKLDRTGSLWVAGGTTGSTLKMVDTGYQMSFGGGAADGWIAQMDPQSGEFLKTTFYGTADYDQVYFIDFDVDDKLYAMGQTNGIIPRSPGTYGNDKTGQFVLRFNNDLDSLEFATTYGSIQRLAQLCPSAFMVDNCYNIYISAWGSNIPPNTSSTTDNLEVSPGALQKTTDGSDFYLYVLGRDAKALQYASFFGGNQSEDHVDGGTSRFDKSGVIYQSVCASCPNAPPGLNDFPITPGAVFPKNVSYRCSNASFKIDFNITYAVEADFDFSPKNGCAPLSIQFTNKSRNAKSFLWDFGDGNTSRQKDPVHQYNKGGTFKIVLKVLDSFSCNINDSAVYELNLEEGSRVEPVYDIRPCSQTVEFKVNGSNLANPVWFFGDGDKATGYSVKHTYKKGNWIVSLKTTNSAGRCPDSAVFPVSVLTDSSGNLDVPNVFTPNGDMVNDCYHLGGISSSCDELDLYIYNRWGLLVFHGTAPEDCWNGRLDNTGAELPEGVYYYLFTRKRKDGPDERGNGTIQLIR